MKSNRIAPGFAALILFGFSTTSEAAPAGMSSAADAKLGTVKIDARGTLHFQFPKASAVDRKIENMDVFSHKGVRYDGQSLRTLVDWLSRRTKPTPALVVAKADPGQLRRSLGTDAARIDDHGLVFVPRTTPRPVPKRKPVATSTETEVLRLVNATRRQYGLQPLSLSSGLCSACRSHSGSMAAYGFFSHSSPVAGQSSFTQRAAAYGATAWAENIAMNGGGAASVVQMWLSSPGHRANMLNPGYRTMGVGRSGSYWTQMFGN